MKIDEYAPTAIPTNSARLRSSRVPGPSSVNPTTRIAAIGRSATTVVLMDRTRVWLTARFAAWVYVIRRVRNASAVFSRTLSKTTTVS
jgi:hypothetical protein